MLNGIQATMHGSLGGILGTTSLAGRDLFYIGILCSLPFIVFQLISSMNSGGGAGLIQSIGFRIFVIMGMMALVTSWQPFANGVEAELLPSSASWRAPRAAESRTSHPMGCSPFTSMSKTLCTRPGTAPSSP
jgi:hypothetical protein